MALTRKAIEARAAHKEAVYREVERINATGGKLSPWQIYKNTGIPAQFCYKYFREYLEENGIEYDYLTNEERKAHEADITNVSLHYSENANLRVECLESIASCLAEEFSRLVHMKKLKWKYNEDAIMRQAVRVSAIRNNLLEELIFTCE